jgi:hypothetical protein
MRGAPGVNLELLQVPCQSRDRGGTLGECRAPNRGAGAAETPAYPAPDSSPRT